MPWQTWPYHRPGSALSFPRDEGWHQLLPGGIADPSLNEMEWVYLNAHLKESGGSERTFVIFVAYFTQWLRLLVVRAFDDDNNPVGVWTGTALGTLHAGTEALDLRFDHSGGEDTWRTATTATGDKVPFASSITASDDAEEFGLHLDLVSKKAPYEAGGIGHLPFGKKGSFFYYSLTDLAVSGTLGLGTDDGGYETVNVSGEGWFDHQWGDFVVTPFRLPHMEEYEWMSVQLDSGDQLMLTTVWEPNGETPSRPEYGGAGLIRADGSWCRLVGAHSWKRIAFWEDPDSHAVYAAGWEFEAPKWDISLRITPRTRDQMTPLVDAPPSGIIPALVSAMVGSAFNFMGSFWEGSCLVEGSVSGSPVKGVAFGELIKRYERPAVTVKIERNKPGLAVVRWQVSNPDEQVPLRHRFYLERPNGGGVLLHYDDLEVPVVVIDEPGLPIGEELVVRVVAHSLDGTLSGTALRSIVLR